VTDESFSKTDRVLEAPNPCAVHLYPCGVVTDESFSKTDPVSSDILRDAA
jgi:hypothetical protein